MFIHALHSLATGHLNTVVASLTGLLFKISVSLTEVEPQPAAQRILVTKPLALSVCISIILTLLKKQRKYCYSFKRQAFDLQTQQQLQLLAATLFGLLAVWNLLWKIILPCTCGLLLSACHSFHRVSLSSDVFICSWTLCASITTFALYMGYMELYSLGVCSVWSPTEASKLFFCCKFGLWAHLNLGLLCSQWER